VRERYGVDPQLVPDFIALRGDPPTASRSARDRRQDGRRAAAAATARSRTWLAAARALENKVRRDAEADEPRTAATLRENEALLLTFSRSRRCNVSTWSYPRRRDRLRGRRNRGARARHAPLGRFGSQNAPSAGG